MINNTGTDGQQVIRAEDRERSREVALYVIDPEPKVALANVEDFPTPALWLLRLYPRGQRWGSPRTGILIILIRKQTKELAEYGREEL